MYMNKTLLTVFMAFLLSACGAMPISDADQKAIKEGKKALLVTNNRQLSDYLYVVPLVTDPMGGQPDQIYIESIDGKKLHVDWKRVNYNLVLEPGKHAIEASCAVDIDDMNRDVNDRSGKDVQYTTQVIEYTFEGGKTYRIYSREYINGTCAMYIEPGKQ